MILRFQVFHLTSAAAFAVSFTFALTKTRAMNSFLLRHATPLLLFLALAASQDFTTGYCFWDCWREREACLHKKGQSHSDWDTLVRTFILTPPPKKKKDISNRTITYTTVTWVQSDTHGCKEQVAASDICIHTSTSSVNEGVGLHHFLVDLLLTLHTPSVEFMPACSFLITWKYSGCR